MLTDARGGYQVSPFKLTKFIDKATPLLAQALTTNARIDAVINIFDNDPDTGETRLETTITLEQAKISSVRVWNSTAAGTPQLCEEIQITYHRIVIANVIGSTETTIQNPASP
ncbi:type VI secretion system tube protein Hcp [Akkermansiaceae bacterium]|nr:type VI secretion system tube protein Hcp [Akkermansiaceae bacterium]